MKRPDGVFRDVGLSPKVSPMAISVEAARKVLCPATMHASDWDLCVGDECMAWRWRANTLATDPKGYCGLAGEG